MEHFMLKKSHDTNHDQDRSAQYDVDFCQGVSHLSPTPQLVHDRTRKCVELMAPADKPSSPVCGVRSENHAL